MDESSETQALPNTANHREHPPRVNRFARRKLLQRIDGLPILDDLQIRRHLGRKLQEARMDASLSQDQVSLILDISRPSISNLECGKRPVDIVELIGLAKLYRKRLKYFFADFDRLSGW